METSPLSVTLRYREMFYIHMKGYKLLGELGMSFFFQGLNTLSRLHTCRPEQCGGQGT